MARSSERKKQWYLENIERIKAQQKEWYLKNREKKIEYYRSTREAVRESRNLALKDRAQDQKKRAVEYLGGKCSICDGSFHQAAMDFHHRDPNEKDYNPTKLMCRKDWEIIKRELDKCILLCSNCHRELHHKEKDFMDLSQVKITINDNGTVDLDNGFFMSTTVSYNDFKTLLSKGNALVAQHERKLNAQAEAQKPKEHA